MLTKLPSDVKEKKKRAHTFFHRHIYLLFLICTLTSVLSTISFAEVSSQAQVLNAEPQVTLIETYSRYTSASDNFKVENFTICLDEKNQTVHLRIIARDRNTREDILSGGNTTFKIIEKSGDVEVTVPEFGNDFKEPVLESLLDTTRISYIDNLTFLDVEDKKYYEVQVNVSDVNGASSLTLGSFTIHNTTCVLNEYTQAFVPNTEYVFSGNQSQIAIVTNESITGQIIITEHDTSPVDSNTNDSLDQYVTIDVSGPVTQVTVNLTITINYTQSEVDSKGLNESTLRLYIWENASWNITPSTIDTENNTITFVFERINTTSAIRLGTFSIRAQPQVDDNDDSEDSGSGSSGGGGGGGPSSRKKIVPKTVPEDEDQGPSLLDQLLQRQLQKQESESTQEDTSQRNEGDSQRLNIEGREDQIITAPGANVQNTQDSRGYTSGLLKEVTTRMEVALQDIELCCILAVLFFILWIVTLIQLIIDRREYKRKLEEVQKKHKHHPKHKKHQ